MLEINPETGMANISHNFTLFEGVPSMDVAIESSYNPNNYIFALSAEKKGRNYLSFFTFDMIKGRRRTTNYSAKNYPFVMTVGYFGDFY
jgi:hypothetical protein